MTSAVTSDVTSDGLPRTGDAAVDAALAPLHAVAAAPGADPLEASRALSQAHQALRARLADAG